MQKTKYRPEIDGLRTIAVIPVILFHLGYNQASGGYLGVDVFFVISGYLITKILTKSILNNEFSMIEFWIRRIKRLIPLLLTVVLFTLFISSFLVFKPDIKDISRDIFPAIFSFFNFHAFLNFGSYWGRASESSFFLHTWSLSVEEQFYLIYPFFLLLSYKLFRNFFLPILVISIASLSIFFFQLYGSKNVDFAFYMLPSRIWELSLGGLASLIHLKKIKTSYSTLLSLSGIGLIVSSYLFAKTSIDYWVIFAVLGSVLILLFCEPSNFLGKILSSKIFVIIGKLSYSLYLWHWVLIVLFKCLPYPLRNYSHHYINGLIIALSFFLSYLSYRFIENKTRNYTHTPKIVVLGLAIIIPLVLYIQSDSFDQYYQNDFNRPSYFVKYYDIAPSLSTISDWIEENNLEYGTTLPDRLQKFNDAYKKNGITTDGHGGTPDVLLIGDSHGVMWAKLLDEILVDLGASLSCYTTNGTKPFFNTLDVNSQTPNEYFTKSQRIEYAKSILRNLDAWQPKLVVLVCRWEKFIDFEEDLYEFLKLLEKKRIRTLLFTQPPALKFMINKQANQYLTYIGLEPVEGYNLLEVRNLNSIIKGNNFIKGLPSKYSNASVFDVYDKLIEQNKVRVSLNDDILFFDDDHLNYAGTLVFKKDIVAILKPLLHTSTDHLNNDTAKLSQ